MDIIDNEVMDIDNERAKILLSLIEGKAVADAPTHVLLQKAIEGYMSTCVSPHQHRSSDVKRTGPRSARRAAHRPGPSSAAKTGPSTDHVAGGHSESAVISLSPSSHPASQNPGVVREACETSSGKKCFLHGSFLKGLTHSKSPAVRDDIEFSVCGKCRDKLFLHQVCLHDFCFLFFVCLGTPCYRYCSCTDHVESERVCLFLLLLIQVAFKGNDVSGDEIYVNGFLVANLMEDKRDGAGNIKIAARRYNFYCFLTRTWYKTSEVLEMLNNGSKNWKQDCYILKGDAVLKFQDFESSSPDLFGVYEQPVFEDSELSQTLSDRGPLKKRHRVR